MLVLSWCWSRGGNLFSTNFVLFIVAMKTSPDVLSNLISPVVRHPGSSALPALHPAFASFPRSVGSVSALPWRRAAQIQMLSIVDAQCRRRAALRWRPLLPTLLGTAALRLWSPLHPHHQAQEVARGSV